MYSRQTNIFKPEEFDLPIHIIGVGATGSWITLALAKLGVSNIHIWDFDIIEEHNIPNQCYNLSDIGTAKVTALEQEIAKKTSTLIHSHDVKVDGSQRLSGVIFLLTDTMKSREDIYYKAIKNNPNIKLLIETRMDLRGGRIYAIDPKKRKHCLEYEKTFYTDEQAEVSACGISQTVIATGLGIASRALWVFLSWINEGHFPNEICDDYSNFYSMNSEW